MPQSSPTGIRKDLFQFLVVNHTDTQYSDSCTSKPLPRKDCGHRVKILSDRTNGRELSAGQAVRAIQANNARTN